MDKVLYINTVSDIRIREMSEGAMNKNKHDYSKDYLTFEALETGTFSLTIPATIDSTYMTSISYSIDDGNTWTTTTVDATAQTITTPTINAGNKVLWKGVGQRMSKNWGNISNFSSTKIFNIYGNIMSLLYGDNFYNQTTLTEQLCYYSIFKDCLIVNASKLILPATTLTKSCYGCMFESCSQLISIPKLDSTTLASSCYASMFKGCSSLVNVSYDLLPATILESSCYDSMFSGCTSLITAPNLPATTLAQYCYAYMFLGCTSLVNAPELPATILAESCYIYMFKDCTSIEIAPELPATTLVNGCYGDRINDGMFYGCSNLRYIKALFLTTPGLDYTGGWVSGVAANGIFVKNVNANWNVTGNNGIPTGWTVDFDTEINAAASTTELTGNSVDGYNLTTTTNRTYAEIQQLNNEIHALQITFGDGKVLELPATSGFTTNHSEIFLNQGDNFYTQISEIFGIDVSSIIYCEVTFNDYQLIINLVTG